VANVRDFGAVGDGQADDTQALQHAVDQGDGRVQIGKGSFRITQTIQVDTTKRGFLSIEGKSGVARVIMDGGGPAFRIVGDHRGTATPSTVKPPTWERERMPMVRSLEILGRHPEADGVQLYRTMQTTMQNLLIRNCRYGVHLLERNRNFLLNASHIYDCGDTGVFFDRCNLHQVIIIGNHISFCKRAGLRQLDGDVHNIQITGNDIEYNSGIDAENSGEIVLEAPDGVISEYTISSNTLQATLPARGANVLVIGREEKPAMSVRLLAITGNVLGSRDKNIVLRHARTATISGNTIYSGEQLNIEATDSHHLAISGNTIHTRPANWKSENGDGVRLGRCVSCSITGNLLNDSKLGDRQRGGAITLEQCDRCSVSSCQIDNPHFAGVDLQDCTRCRISDNSIVDDRDPIAMYAAVRLHGASRDNLIQNNAITHGRDAAVHCPIEMGVMRSNTIWP
jgi:parallel beta-helix repeat protein